MMPSLQQHVQPWDGAAAQGAPTEVTAENQEPGPELEKASEALTSDTTLRGTPKISVIQIIFQSNFLKDQN